MLDNRIYTFLKLCETMNYRKTAELLNMTQPAVTQHIHCLEGVYNAKLFEYSGKALSKTAAGIRLEEYSRSVVYNETVFKAQLAKQDRQKISVGATKTIGDYIINNLVSYCLKNESIQFELIIDNTKFLLQQLDSFELDFLMLEGYFDKTKYDYKPIRNEELVGICAPDHPFANREVELEDIFGEHIIVRESGSGTRKVFENFLEERNYSYSRFKRVSVVSSFNLIQSAVESGIGISFVYLAIPSKNEKLATFRIKDSRIFHELNYVFLKKSKAVELIALLENNI